MGYSNAEQTAIKNGFTLVRQKKHKVYRDALGRTLVFPSTPSDRNWEQNAMRDIARVIGRERLQNDPKPLRSLREKTRLEPAERIAPATPVVPATPVSRMKPRVLKPRLTKEEIRAGIERARRHAQLMPLVIATRRYFAEGEKNIVDVAVQLSSMLCDIGYDSECVLMSPVGTPIGDGDTVFATPAVRCGNEYIDIYKPAIYRTSRWTIRQEGSEWEIEAVVSLKDLAELYEENQEEAKETLHELFGKP